MRYSSKPGRTTLRWIFGSVIIVAILGQVAGAAAAGNGARERQVLQSKLRMLDNILFRSERARRIEASGNRRATALLGDAKNAYRQARALFEAGDLEQARQASRISLEHVTRAFALIVDTEGLNAQARERYRELLENIRVYEKALSDTARRKGLPLSRLLDQAQVERWIRAAQGHAEQGDYAAALKTLGRASAAVESALSQARARETVTYALEFATPEDEYRYEFERNRSYVALAQILLNTAPAEMRRRIPLLKRLIAKSEQQVEKAEALKQAGDMNRALATIEQANKTIVQALRMGGLAL